MDDHEPETSSRGMFAAVLATAEKVIRRARCENLRARIRLLRLTADGRVRVGKGCHIDPAARIDLSWGGSIQLGNWCCLCHGALLAPYGGKITFGDRVYIGPYCVVYGHGDLTVGKYTMIAAHTVIIPANHAFDRLDQPICDQPVTRLGVEIGEDCWIASGVRILDGVRIGNGCVVGAGAVVTRSLPDYSIAVGVPAKVLRSRRAGESPEQALVAVGASHGLSTAP
jgi:serine acetyltransferase